MSTDKGFLLLVLLAAFAPAAAQVDCADPSVESCFPGDYKACYDGSRAFVNCTDRSDVLCFKDGIYQPCHPDSRKTLCTDGTGIRWHCTYANHDTMCFTDGIYRPCTRTDLPQLCLVGSSVRSCRPVSHHWCYSGGGVFRSCSHGGSPMCFNGTHYHPCGLRERRGANLCREGNVLYWCAKSGCVDDLGYVAPSCTPKYRCIAEDGKPQPCSFILGLCFANSTFYACPDDSLRMCWGVNGVIKPCTSVDYAVDPTHPRAERLCRSGDVAWRCNEVESLAMCNVGAYRMPCDTAVVARSYTSLSTSYSSSPPPSPLTSSFSSSPSPSPSPSPRPSSHVPSPPPHSAPPPMPCQLDDQPVSECNAVGLCYDGLKGVFSNHCSPSDPRMCYNGTHYHPCTVPDRAVTGDQPTSKWMCLNGIVVWACTAPERRVNCLFKAAYYRSCRTGRCGADLHKCGPSEGDEVVDCLSSSGTTFPCRGREMCYNGTHHLPCWVGDSAGGAAEGAVLCLEGSTAYVCDARSRGVCLQGGYLSSKCLRGVCLTANGTQPCASHPLPLCQAQDGGYEVCRGSSDALCPSPRGVLIPCTGSEPCSGYAECTNVARATLCFNGTAFTPCLIHVENNRLCDDGDPCLYSSRSTQLCASSYGYYFPCPATPAGPQPPTPEEVDRVSRSEAPASSDEGTQAWIYVAMAAVGLSVFALVVYVMIDQSSTWLEHKIRKWCHARGLPQPTSVTVKPKDGLEYVWIEMPIEKTDEEFSALVRSFKGPIRQFRRKKLRLFMCGPSQAQEECAYEMDHYYYATGE